MSTNRAPRSPAFSDHQYEAAYPDGWARHWWALARNRILTRTLRRILRPGAAVLEVGCGRGFVVEHLRREGIDCLGVDLAAARPLASVRDHVRTETDATVLPVAERERFEAVLLLDVIEHMDDPAGFLEALAAAFPNARHFVVTVPARAELWSNYDDAYGHHRRYSVTMLQDLSGAVGLRAVSVGYFFHLAYLPMWIAARLAGARPILLRAPGDLEAWAHRLAAAGCYLDYRLLPRSWPGTSLLAVFRT